MTISRFMSYLYGCTGQGYEAVHKKDEDSVSKAFDTELKKLQNLDKIDKKTTFEIESLVDSLSSSVSKLQLELMSEENLKELTAELMRLSVESYRFKDGMIHKLIDAKPSKVGLKRAILEKIIDDLIFTGSLGN